jgi:Rieske Fe-S protein
MSSVQFIRDYWRNRWENPVHRSQFDKYSGKMSPSNPAELFFQKVDVYEDIRDGVFIHHRNIPPRQEILCGRQ